MGAWGTGLFEDDFVSDIRGDFEEMLEEGVKVPTITKRLLKEYADVIKEDEEKGPVVYLALASLQMEYNALQPEIRDKAVNIITNGEGLALWEDVGPDAVAERKRALEELKSQLLSFEKKVEKKPKRPKRIKVRIGDLFALPVGDSRYCYGHVFDVDGCIVYDFAADSHPSVEEIVRHPIAFLAFTSLYPIEDGDWQLVGSHPLPMVHFPLFKVETPDGFMVTSHDDQVWRPATDEEKQQLNYKKSISPTLIEEAVRAKFGSEEWKDAMNFILYRA